MKSRCIWTTLEFAWKPTKTCYYRNNYALKRVNEYSPCVWETNQQVFCVFVTQTKKRQYDTEVENMERQQKQTIERLEQEHTNHLRDEAKRIKGEQDKELSKFQNMTKNRKKEVWATWTWQDKRELVNVVQDRFTYSCLILVIKAIKRNFIHCMTIYHSITMSLIRNYWSSHSKISVQRQCTVFFAVSLHYSGQAFHQIL